MARNPHSEVLEQVEDYKISDIVIRNSVGKRLNIPVGVITELNIFESIDNNAVTGSMYLIDNYNIVTQAELQGNERLSFKLSTPGRQRAGFNHIVDASEDTGYPYHIYAVKHRRPASETVSTYEVLFASRELMMNTRKRVNRSLTGRFDQQMIKILRDDNGINTRKRILFEPTRNRDTVVYPNLRPFDAINLLARRSLSGNAKGAGYYFYETTKAFYFRSVENMIADQSTDPRKVSRVFKYEKPTISSGIGARRFDTQRSNVLEYRFLQHFNTLTNQAAGTYASNVITYNIFDKSYDSKRYKYHDHYQRHMHTDTDKDLPESKRSYPIAQNPVDRERKEGSAVGDKTVSDYPESKIILQPSTRFLHNDDTGVFGTSTESEGITEAIRVSQQNQVSNSTRLEIVTAGASDLEVGDMIEFEMPKMIPGGADPQDYKGDERYSGRYLITKLRHRIMDKSYRQVLHCIKDSVVTNLIENVGSNFPDKESPRRLSQDLYSDPLKSTQSTGPNLQNR